MPVKIPDSHKDLLDGPVVVTLATVMPNGQPHTAPVWCMYDDSHIIIEASQDTRKVKNVRHNPRVSITALDPQNPYRYLEVRGTVEEVTQEGAMAALDELTRQYTGKPAYYGHIIPLEQKGKFVHLLLKIKPARCITRDLSS